MKKETVDVLLNLIFTNFTVAVETNQQFMALELALNETAPEVAATYRKHLEKVRESARGMPLGVFEDLRTKLLQE